MYKFDVMYYKTNIPNKEQLFVEPAEPLKYMATITKDSTTITKKSITITKDSTTITKESTTITKDSTL